MYRLAKNIVKLMSSLIPVSSRRKHFRRSLLERLNAHESAKIAMAKRRACGTTLYYHESLNNFGDMLSHFVVERASKKKVNCETDLEWCEMIAIGSIIQDFFAEELLSDLPLNVWGSGFISDISIAEIAFGRKMLFHALRGELTKNKLLLAGYDVQHVALGDPGLLVSDCFSYEKSEEYDVGVILHFIDVDLGTGLLNDLKNLGKTFLLIDICANAEEVVQSIAKCRVVISSAMHGLIAADSMTVPNLRIRLSDNVIGGDYKFDDYYSALGVKSRVLDLRENHLSAKDIAGVKQDYAVCSSVVADVKLSLYKAYPHDSIRRI